MLIHIDSTTEELQAKTAALEKALAENDIDKRHWLEALLPTEDGKNPYKGLPEENEKNEQWWDLYDGAFSKPRTAMLERILNALLTEEPDEATINGVMPFLVSYARNDTGGVAYKSGLLLEKYSLDEQVSALLPLPEGADDFKCSDALRALSRFAYEQPLSRPVAEQLIAALKLALERAYSRTKPYFYVFDVVQKLAPQYPEALGQLQEPMVEVLDLEHMEHDEYDSALHMLKEAWPQLQPFWTAENKDALIEKILQVIEDEFSPGDAFVEDGALRAIKVIGAGHAGAQETIERVEQELADYYAQEDAEEEEE